MEFDLLRVFAEHPNRVLSRDQLLTLTRNRDWEPFDRSIDIRIARLRRKVEADPEKPEDHQDGARRRLYIHSLKKGSGPFFNKRVLTPFQSCYPDVSAT